MIVVLKKDVSRSDVDELTKKLREFGCDFSIYENGEPIIRIRSRQNLLSKDFLLSQPGVQNAFRISPAYPLASRRSDQEATTIQGDGWKIESMHFTIMAGPCAVESEEQIQAIAQSLSAEGIRFLRGGAYKPRTSPYAFQGLGAEGLQMMRRAADRFGMRMVTEAVSSADVALVAEYADIIQIGTRNMQNFRLLKTVGKQKRPVLLKR